MQFAAENSQVLQSLVAVIRSASQLNANDIGFIRTLDRTLKTSSQKQSQRLLELISKIITTATGEETVLTSAADLTAKWTVVGRAFDVLLDKAENALAEPTESRHSTPMASDGPDVVTHEKSLDKPQDKFADDIDNSVGPFRPKLTSKPHSIVPLSESFALRAPDTNHLYEWYGQPYREEILQAEYPPAVYEKTEPILYCDWDQTPLTYVDTPQKLKKMVSKLGKSTEIAVDLEHHDLRSYLGLLCLMQISTRTEDFIVDTLALRTELQILNDVFCDPKIIKVFHGAYMDIQWLQRDLGVYVVNLFDTFHASRALGSVKHSLAFLLEKYVNFVPSKQYQRADWRVRPLGQELINYARADTHFLLYIYDILRNSLLDANKMDGVLQESRKTAEKRYEKPGRTAEPGWLKLAITHHLNPQQSGVLSKLYEWRDNLARQLDESPGYIMPVHLLTTLAAMHPTTPGAVVTAASRVPKFVRNEAQTIANLITGALDSPIDIFSLVKSTSQSSLDLFSENALNEVGSLRLPPTKSGIYFELPTKLSPPDGIYLGHFKMDDLNKPLREPASPDASSPEAEITTGVENGAEKPGKVESDSDSESEQEVLEVPKSRKRKIQVVQSLDDVKLQPTLSNNRVLKDEEAFDFEAAEAVAHERQTPAFKQFRGKDSGPRGARGPRRVAQGRSKTFRR